MHLSTLLVANKNQIIAFFMVAMVPLTYAMSGISTEPLPPKPAVAQVKPVVAPAVASKPSWQELSAAQKTALAPLMVEWSRMSEQQKIKWLEIIKKYPKMTPDEQARLQERMRAWVKLTPEQRMQVRENFARTTQIKPEKKSEQWQQYQKLSDEQKKKLADEAVKKKSVTNLPSEAQRKATPLAPIKGALKPVQAAEPKKPAPPATPHPASMPAGLPLQSAPTSQAAVK